MFDSQVKKLALKIKHFQHEARRYVKPRYPSNELENLNLASTGLNVMPRLLWTERRHDSRAKRHKTNSDDG